jgi:hypothetical protein
VPLTASMKVAIPIVILRAALPVFLVFATQTSQNATFGR